MKDYFGYSGKVCVVTGAGSGMGKATAELLVELGAEVYAMDFREPQIDGIRKWIPTNLLEKDGIDEAFSQIPEEIDCYFGIAGVSGDKYSFAHTVTVDYIANRYITEKYLDVRMNRGGGIVYVGSQVIRNWCLPDISDEYMPLLEAKTWDEMRETAEKLGEQYPASFAYILAKRAVACYAARNTAHFGEKDVRVNLIVPASTNTNMMAEGIASAGNDDLYRICTVKGKEYAQPSVMARAMAYLNSDFAEYISGVELYVDWGLEAAMRVGQVGDPMGMGLSLKTMMGK